MIGRPWWRPPRVLWCLDASLDPSSVDIFQTGKDRKISPDRWNKLNTLNERFWHFTFLLANERASWKFLNGFPHCTKNPSSLLSKAKNPFGPTEIFTLPSLTTTIRQFNVRHCYDHLVWKTTVVWQVFLQKIVLCFLSFHFRVGTVDVQCCYWPWWEWYQLDFWFLWLQITTYTWLDTCWQEAWILPCT